MQLNKQNNISKWFVKYVRAKIITTKKLDKSGLSSFILYIKQSRSLARKYTRKNEYLCNITQTSQREIGGLSQWWQIHDLFRLEHTV